MRTIIAGSRNITNADLIRQAIQESGFDITQVITGGARGVDRIAHDICKAKYDCKIFYADWNKYNKRAGMIRNNEMADNADALIAIWDGKSKGTENMIKTAKAKGLKVYVKF